MNINENDVKVIDIARELVLQSDSASYQRGIVEMLANYLEVDYTEAVDLIHDTQTPRNEHIVLVAFHMVGPETMKDAQLKLMKLLPDERDTDNELESWWVAMDERYQASDNDSAEFVPGTGRDAWYRYHEHVGTKGISRPESELVRPTAPQGYLVTDYRPAIESMHQRRTMRSSVLQQVQGFHFDNERQARKFLDGMNQKIAVFGIATINDAADLLGLPATFAGEKMGWHARLPYTCLRQIKFEHGRTLDLPTPTHKIR